MLQNYKISLPQKNQGNVEIETTNSLLFLGANGAGKTRLGSWIEFNSPHKDKVHRISAQKSLTMPDTATPTAIDLAETDLLYGNPQHGRQNKSAYRWGNKPAVSFLNDFQKLMVYLFSEHTEESAKYLQAAKASSQRVNPPTTKLDLVKQVWDEILPHRELIIGGLTIETRVKGQGQAKYKSSEMSDGERIIFYLAGQCLSAPQNGIIVIDEPELHLHKSVQEPLWSRLERLRTDCLFIYLTHDVDFAAAKESSKKIWLQSYDGGSWEWEELLPTNDFPEDLLLEILGSRKPVVFVEGINGSFDSALYTAILPGFLVIPRGSCSQVIQSVKALKSNQQIHHLEVYGVIDRDRRVPAEIAKLEQDSIYVLNVAEVENLFCTQEVLKIVSNRLARDPEADFQAVSKTVFSRLQGELDTQVSLRASSEIKFQLNMFNDGQKGAEAIDAALQSLVTQIDVDKIYSDANELYVSVLETKNYDELLALFNRKSLSSQVSTALGLANGSLPETVVRLAKGDCKEDIIHALKPYFGNFQQYMA
ncbi:putative AAA domain-containing protein, AbiEii toxin, Type IV TA system [uncultured Thiomicrorhabdus sp.]